MVLAAESHPGLEAEAAYSEAVIAYHLKKLKLSNEIIDELLQKNPKHIEALELKALNLKELGKERERIPVLRQVLLAKPENQRGAVFFELGLLYQKFGDAKQARRHFEGAAKLGFNLVPASLLAGMIAFNDADMGGAEGHMRTVRSRGSTEMELAGSYYLGLINFKRGSGALGAGYMLDAQRLARENPGLPMSQQLSGPINQVLDPFKKSQWFTNLSVLAQYDSNILQLPTSASVQQGSNEATPKTTILAGFGYMGSPLSEVQFVPSYRFNTNKNFGSNLESFEYASNTLALAMNWRPLARFSAALKGELTHSFQNSTDSYRSFTLAGDFGPSFKWVQSENLQLQLDASYRPLINFAQADFGGTGMGVRLSYRRDGATRYFNPVASASWDHSGTRNTSFRSTALSGSLSNLLRLPNDHQLTPGIDYIRTDYALADPVRNDTTLVMRMAWARPVSAQWTYLGDFSYTANTSNLSGAFTFNRWVVGFGVSYTR